MLVDDFEGEHNITDALEYFLINKIQRFNTIKVPKRKGTIVSPQDPQSYVIIAKKNYEMKWSSSHWQSDNQLRLDLDEADNLTKNIRNLQ